METINLAIEAAEARMDATSRDWHASLADGRDHIDCGIAFLRYKHALLERMRALCDAGRLRSTRAQIEASFGAEYASARVALDDLRKNTMSDGSCGCGQCPVWTRTRRG